MRVPSALITAGLAVSLATQPSPALADDAATADPFRPVQPAWPEGWSAPGDAPTEAAPEAPAAGTEGQLVDEAEVAGEAAIEGEPAALAENALEPTAELLTEPEPAESRVPPANVNLRTPHLLMGTGGALIGVSAIAAIAIGITMDRPDLAGATFALGGVLGLSGLTVGVVMQNHRLEAAGHDVVPALPSGIMLKVALVR